MIKRKEVVTMTAVPILALGVERDTHKEQEPKLPGSTSVMRTLRNIGTTGTSICKWTTSSNILSLQLITLKKNGQRPGLINNGSDNDAVQPQVGSKEIW